MGIVAFEAPFMSDGFDPGNPGEVSKDESAWELVLGYRRPGLWVGAFCTRKWMCNRFKDMYQCRPLGFHPDIPRFDGALSIWRRL
jgi:hypothetical protein